MTDMGGGIPAPILDWLMEQCAGERGLAWAELEDDGVRVRRAGGAWDRYAGMDVRPGMEADGLHDALAGMLPFDEAWSLPMIELADGGHADLHGLVLDGRRWILWRDVSRGVEAARGMQQSANEGQLRQARRARVLDRYLGREVAGLIERGEVRLNAAGERREIVTLFADVRGFTAFNERHDAQEVMDSLNEYMAAMLEPVLDEGGVVDKIIGDGIMAVFGMSGNAGNVVAAATAGWRAARRILDGVAVVNARRAARGAETLGAGVGLAAGEAVLGLLGGRRRRAFTAIGRHVNLAARLEDAAGAGEALVAEDAWRAIEPRPHGLQPRMLDVRGIGPTRVYCWRAPSGALSGQ